MKNKGYKPSVYVVCAQKGGVGKTVTACRIAVMFAQEGARVLLVDADEQESTFKFSVQRESAGVSPSMTCVKLSDMAVRTDVLKLKKNYDVVVIDSGGRDTKSMRAAASVANILITPCPPFSLDLWEVKKVDELVEEVKSINPDIKAVSFLNKAESMSKSKDNDAIIEYLKDQSEVKNISYMNTPVVSRKSISTAIGKGLISNEDRPKDKKAILELEKFFNEVKKVSK
jgi:chromosome partitioning protein